LNVHPAVGAALFAAGIALFVVGIVDATADAPSGSLSAKGGDTPWLIFAGVACSILGGILFSVTAARRRRLPEPAGEQLRAFVAPGIPATPGPIQAASRPADPVERLEKLVALRDAGALTAVEFEAQKARILGES
jgi:hypothetical protein